MTAAPRYACIAPRHVAPEGFTAIDHGILYDHRLSLGAVGLISEMLSYPQDWTTTAAELASRGLEPFAEVVELLAELETAGMVKQVAP